MQKITPFLWFDDNAEEAVNLYTSLFKNSTTGSVTRYDKAGAAVSGRAEGSVMTIEFTIEGQNFIALNGGPHFKFTEAVSFLVQCKDQQEIDRYWEKLSEGGEEAPCGWLKDKFGLSWQIVPENLPELLNNGNDALQAFFQMKKIDIKTLEKGSAESI
jgi:predicted 3-demethylubiquinone-9 3-methyltransferase (glyoxalase superfamily)